MLVMVSVEELASLDFVLWRRTGKQAAQALGCNQSTISRRLARCLEIFGLTMRRSRNEWEAPYSPLLQMERELHQHCRLLGRHPLRLEACPLAAPLLSQALPEGWIGGCYDHIGVERPMGLLRERVIDAWLCTARHELSLPSRPSDLVLHPLWGHPMTLHAAPGLPLAGERDLTSGDLAPDRPGGWLQRAGDASTMTLNAPAPFGNGALLCHRTLADHPSIQLLLETLRWRLARMAAVRAELECL